MNPDSLPQQRHIWGRRQSRPLREKQRQAFKALWPNVSLELPERTRVDVTGLFSFHSKDLWIEIGFGGGEHLATQATLHPNIGFIGCEPFVNGVASLMVHMQNQNLKNIRVVKDDARLLLARLPDRSTGKIFILFPDPWPKQRHHKRRIVQDATITLCKRLLKQSGFLVMATDDAPYAKWMQEIMAQHPEFELLLEDRKTIYERPQNWPPTRYEQKAIIQGRTPAYLIYQLKEDSGML